MGMAYQGPENGGRTKRYVSKHAMDRLRQRSKSIVHLREHDLMFMIDDVVERGIKEGYVEGIIDSEGEEATMVEISKTLDQTLMAGIVFALIKPDYKEGRRDAIVTIFDEKMAQRLRKKEVSWKQTMGEPLNQPFQALADMRIEPKAEEPVLEPPKLEEPQYLVLDSSNGDVEMGTRQEMLDLIESRGRGFRLFKECKLKIKVEVEE